MTADTVKSARRVFEVLELFDARREPLTLKQVCDQHRYPASSGAAILKSLVRLGYLEYDKTSRTYLPTMRIAALGGWVAGELFGQTNVIRLMQGLRAKTGENVILAAQSDLHAQYVHVVRARAALADSVGPGTLRPLVNSALGRLLLSVQPDSTIAHLVRRLDASRDPGAARVDLAGLLATVGAIRQDGYVLSRDLVTPGIGVIGVMLPKTPFHRLFALGLGGPSARIRSNRERYLCLLRETVSRFEEGSVAEDP